MKLKKEFSEFFKAIIIDSETDQLIENDMVPKKVTLLCTSESL